MGGKWIEYQDYVLAIAALDAEWSRAVPAEGETYADAVWHCMSESHRAVAISMSQYAEKADALHDAWLGGNQRSGESEKIDPKLFSTQSWLPFGHLDVISLQLVDDLECVHTVSEGYSKGVEELTTAFCPQMAQFGGSALFLDALNLFDDRKRVLSWEPQCGQRERPLMLFSRLRMTPLLTLGRALTAQASVFHLLAKKLEEVWKDLNTTFVPEAVAFSNLSVHSQNSRVTFLDLQDEEEIGILVTGTHYSAMMALVATAQHLTLADWRANDSDAARVVLSSRCMKEILGCPPDEDALGHGSFTSVEGNHIFRWSRTLAAVAPHLGKTGKGAGCNVGGVIRLDTEVNFMLGHQLVVEDIVKSLSAVQPGALDQGLHLHTLGTSDQLINWEKKEPGPKSEGRFLPTCEAAALWSEIIVEVSKLKAKSGQRRDVSGWNSTVTIPVPRHPLIHRKVGANHKPLFHELLSKLKSSRLRFLDCDKISDSTRAMGLPQAERRPLIYLAQNAAQVFSNPLLFDILLDHLDVLESLAYALSEVLPDAVASGFESGVYYTPRAPFKLVQQLYHLLNALDDVLELRFRRVYPDAPVRDWSLDLRSQNHQILLCADAVLKCAVAIFRGDLLDLHNKKYESENDQKQSETSIRQSLGVILRLCFHPGIRANYLSAFHRLPQRPSLLRKPSEKEPARLAVFEADYAHLRSILCFSHTFHESFHLIFDELASPSSSHTPDKLTWLRFPSDLLRRYFQPDRDPIYHDLSETSQEMFCHMMMLLYVFDGDMNLMLADHLQDLAVSPASAPGDREFNLAVERGIREKERDGAVEIRRRAFCQHFFFVAAPIIWLRHVLNPAVEMGACELARAAVPASNRSAAPTLVEFADEAWEMLKRFGPLYGDFETLFPSLSEPAIESSVKRFLSDLYGRTYSCLPEFWTRVRVLFSRHVNRTVLEHTAPDDAMEDDIPQLSYLPESDAEASEWIPDAVVEVYNALQRNVDEELRSSWLECGHSFQGVAGDGIRGMDLGDSMNPNLLVRRSLYHYIKRYRHQVSVTGSIYLPRDPKTGDIQVEALTQKPHSEFLLDRNAVELFSTVPAARRCRTGQNIAFLKTLWDIASRNRARRLVSLKMRLS